MPTKYRPTPLTEDEIKDALRRRAEGEKLISIADSLHRSEGSISRLCSGKTFRRYSEIEQAQEAAF